MVIDTIYDRCHGSLFDRGSADSWYHRQPDPHYWPNGTGNGARIQVTDPADIAEYMAGYDYNEKHGGKKDWD